MINTANFDTFNLSFFRKPDVIGQFRRRIRFQRTKVEKLLFLQISKKVYLYNCVISTSKTFLIIDVWIRDINVFFL